MHEARRAHMARLLVACAVVLSPTACYRTGVLLSHRLHEPRLGDVVVALDRAIAGDVLVRRATFRGVVQDERVTKRALGVDSERSRHRVVIPLDDALVATAGSMETVLGGGMLVFVPEGTDHAFRVGSDVLEIEWDAGALGDAHLSAVAATVKLGADGRAAMRALASSVRGADDSRALAAPLASALAVLVAEGIGVSPDRAAEITRPSAAREQLLMDRLDAALSDLPGAPMLVDLEATLGCSGRTVSRHVRDVHARHALLGRGGGRWRGIRDATRLVMASIFLSHRDATPASVSAMVGYGSVEALDHAFRDAGLPPPRALQRALAA